MFKVCLRTGLSVFGITFVCANLQANDYFVAPQGATNGPGSLTSPYDLATAFSGRVGRPGDTFWLLGGDYKLGHLETTNQGAAGKPITFREMPGQDARIDGSLVIFHSAGYLVFRDFELYSSDTNRLSHQTNAGFDVTDITLIPGIACYAPNMSFINLVVHDQTRHGIYLSESSSNSLVYGCILFNNGWASPDNAEGHGLYVQGDSGTKLIGDNIVFNNSGANMHVYENTNNERLIGVTLQGNVAFHGGGIQNVRPYRSWIVGVDAPALYADGIVLRDNMAYEEPARASLSEIQIGREQTNGSVALIDNYLPVGLLMNNWRNATVSGNLIAPLPGTSAVSLNQSFTPLSAAWEHNTYVCATVGTNFQLNSTAQSFAAWHAATGFDQQSMFEVGHLSDTTVFVRPNTYQPGRANIIIYNWNNLNSVVVDVRSVLAIGTRYEVRNVQDLQAPPLLSGVYRGQPLRLPMTGLSVASPNGPLITPPPTGPTFNVFVLLPTGQAMLGTPARTPQPP